MLKVMSKMGISTFRFIQIFDAVGLSSNVVKIFYCIATRIAPKEIKVK